METDKRVGEYTLALNRYRDVLTGVEPEESYIYSIYIYMREYTLI